jgi:malate dehydrogenase (oxaloacetate-decarboxylating)(NADP+)
VPKHLSEELRSGALAYHRLPQPGKLETVPIKPLGNQHDLALAYSPGVAAACEAIAADPTQAAHLTVRGNLVAVVSNGTAVLGLGNIGPLAGKPVMEGKAVLFKKFAGIDVFDIEIAASDVDKMVEVIAALEPTFGGINLEDIRAPDCFEVEARLQARMNIPVFHDDQHGTAIIVAAAIHNALQIAQKRLDGVKIVTAGAGAAALACLDLLISRGARRESIWVTDIDGLVYEGRLSSMDRWKAAYAQRTPKRTLSDVIEGADIFLGLSVGGVLGPAMVKRMAARPLIMALANPTPEIMPQEALAVRPDAMICTGRSDYANQVNNVLCFPFIFRGALDVGATAINQPMKQAAVEAIAALAREPPSDVAARAYGGEARSFGAGSLIPNPFDPRLILRIAPAVARAAMESGVATRPIADFETYQERLNGFVFRSGFIMKPVFAQAKLDRKRVIYSEGENQRILQATQVVVEEALAHPILVGRPGVIEARLERLGLSIRSGRHFELVNPDGDPRYDENVRGYVEAAGRRGITPEGARTIVRTNATVIAALALHRGEVDAMICGVEGRYMGHLKSIRDIVGLASGLRDFAALSLVITGKGPYFIADTQVTPEPSCEDVAEMAVLAAAHVRRFGLEPKIALVSHSDFGSYETPSALKMRCARERLAANHPDLEVDGEMDAESALNPVYRGQVLPHSRLKGAANVLIMPDLDAANIVYQAVKVLADALPVGPILIGAARPAHILTPSVTARGIVNMTAIAAVEAQCARGCSG